MTAGRLDIRWFTTGDFSFHYTEHHENGEHWECRWDRHPNAHDTRLHFHEPLSATEVVDLDLPARHPLDGTHGDSDACQDAVVERRLATNNATTETSTVDSQTAVATGTT